jgi:hypothetical protein
MFGERMMTKRLYKTKLIIWTEYNPGLVELEDLARDATVGDAYCSQRLFDIVDEPDFDPDWDDTGFFDGDEDDD